MQVVPSGGHIGNQFKLRYLVAKILTNESDATCQEKAENVWAHSYMHFAAQEKKLPLKSGLKFPFELD